MMVTLTPEQQAWVAAHVARGDFPSVEAAVHQLRDERIAERSAEEDDLAWAKPIVDVALAEAERGRVSPLEDHQSRMDALLASMKS